MVGRLLPQAPPLAGAAASSRHGLRTAAGLTRRAGDSPPYHMPGSASRTAGSCSRMPGSSSRTAGALHRTVGAASRTRKIIQPHGWQRQPHRCRHLTARLERPAAPGKRPAMRLPGSAVRINRPAAPEQPSGVRLQPSAVGLGPLQASLARRSMRVARRAGRRLGVAAARPAVWRQGRPAPAPADDRADATVILRSARQSLRLPSSPRHEDVVLGRHQSGHRPALHLR